MTNCSKGFGMLGSRRRTRLACGLAVVLVGVVAGGCGGSVAPQSTSTAGAGSATAGSAAPTKDIASLSWWVFYRPLLSLDPVKNEDYPENTILGNLCEPLMTVTPDFGVVPNLATKADGSDPARWVLTIRSGVKFWDGSPMTVDDVVYSLRRNFVAANASIFGATMLSEIKRVAKTGPDQVTITLRAPDVTFDERMVLGGAMVMSRAYAEKQGDKLGTPGGRVMCTGPYEPKSWDGATKLTVVRNTGYWNQQARPRVGQISFVWPQDPGVVANSLASGELDGGFNLPPATVSKLQSSSAGTLRVGTASQTLMVELLAFINAKGSGAEDPRVRQALNLAVDRQGLVSSVYQGLAAPAYTLAPPGTWGYAKDAFSAAYQRATKPQDLAAAKQLVAAAGPAAKRPIVIATPAGQPLSIDQISIIQQNAQAIGLKVHIKTIPPEQYGALFSDPSSRKGINALLTIGYDHVQDPLLNYDNALAPRGISNYGAYANPTVIGLLAQAKAQPDPAKRAALILRIQDQFLKDLPAIPLLAPYTTVYQRNGLTGAPLTYTYQGTAWTTQLGGTT